MSKKDLQKAIISTSADNFPLDFDIKVVQFTVHLDKNKIVICDGNRFNNDATSKIDKLKIGSIVTISQIHIRSDFMGCIRPIPPIQVKIVN